MRGSGVQIPLAAPPFLHLPSVSFISSILFRNQQSSAVDVRAIEMDDPTLRPPMGTHSLYAAGSALCGVTKKRGKIKLMREHLRARKGAKWIVPMTVCGLAAGQALAAAPSVSALLEEITVTATKRAKGLSVHETPVAVTALGAVQIETAHVQSLSDLTNMIPNVFLNSAVVVPGANNFTIRGMGIYSTIPSSTPTVGVFVDGVYVGANAGIALKNTFDLEGIEVLRGPQGLLFGRNVTAGAILVRTTEPTDELRIHAKAAIESGPHMITSAVVSGPLSEDGAWSGKLAVQYSNDRGYFTNLYDGNDNFGKSTSGVVRGAVKWKSSDTFTTVLRFEDGSHRGDGPATQDHAQFDRNSHDFAIDTTGFNDADWRNITMENRWDVGFGDGQIINIFSWRDLNARNLTDIDATILQNFDDWQSVKHDQFSNELRYAGTFGPVTTTIGAFYYWDKLNYVEARDLLLSTVHLIGGGRQKSFTWAIFTSVDVDLPANFVLNLGARYSEEEKDAFVQRLIPNGPCSFVTQFCTEFNFADEDDWSAFTPKVGLQWNPTDETHLYAFWTKGFRSGGYNLRQTAITSPPGPYDQEVVDSYEAGWKQRAFDDRLRLAVSVFRNDYKKLQKDLIFTDPDLGLIQTTLNTADVKIQGFEVETTWQIIDQLTLQGNLGHIDTNIKRLRYALAPTGIITPDQLELDLPFMSKWSYGGALLYTAELDVGSLSGRVAFQHMDRAYSDDLNTLTLNPVNNLDADITLDLANTNFSVSVYGRNILDKTTFGLNTALPFAPGQTFSSINKGRVLGLELRYKH